MAKRRNVIVFYVFLLQFINAFGAETAEDIKEETESFKNLPTLIEYVLDMLERKPEVLETDDVNVFKRSADDNCETDAEACISADTRYKKAADKYDMPAENSPFKHINKYSGTDVVKKNAGEVWNTNDMYKRRQNNGDYVPTGVTNIETSTIDIRTIVSNAQEIGSTIGLASDDIYAVDRTARKTKWGQLSPEEVEEQLLKVDQMIEDYNSKETKE